MADHTLTEAREAAADSLARIRGISRAAAFLLAKKLDASQCESVIDAHNQARQAIERMLQPPDATTTQRTAPPAPPKPKQDK